MHFSWLTSFGVYAAYASFAAAAPGTPARAQPCPDNCKPEDVVIAGLKSQYKALATSFCSSYLHLPYVTTVTRTASVTRTATQLTTLPDVTQTALTTNAVTDVETTLITLPPEPNPTTTVTVTVTDGSASTVTVYRRSVAEKRAVAPRKLAFPSSLISSACSCVVKPTVRTVTQTATRTAGVTRAQTVGPLATDTVVQTVVVTVTSLVDETVTVGPTSTVTSAATAVVAPPVATRTLPAICNAQGLPGAHAFNFDANFNSDQASCIASCKTNDRCFATGFYIVTDPTTGSQTGTCRFYDKPVADTANLGFGYYNFNDKDC